MPAEIPLPEARLSEARTEPRCPRLDAGAIAVHLMRIGGRADWDVRVASSIDSTNSALMSEARRSPDPFARPALLATDMQTAGRGRLGRIWRSSPGASLAISFGWRFGPAASAGGLAGLSLVCGLAACAALSDFGLRCRLKWPNDVLVNGRKIAGILVETQQTGAVRTAAAPRGRTTAVVAGIGINLGPEAHRFAADGSAVSDRIDATDAWSETGLAIDPNVLSAKLAQAIEARFVQFESEGFGAFVDEWNALHAWNGMHVALLDAGSSVASGVALGVDALGRLRLETADGVRTAIAGDVSLRAMPDAARSRASR